ncbi:MFS transporter [Tenggerimyces flavus]|uniref:MFS transporter n=1 Tax=Tenggerimyces flavus TaxID=1708749 RepID=A0ABV7Y6Q6_9ACTN|nr:MFS transporter [Tenggerimyces flavus]MBM7791013.1 MFS family permease [Tenggerimyces flavus]
MGASISRSGLGRSLNKNFKWYWTGESISLLGTEISLTTIPLIVAVTLHASATEVGLMRALVFVPFMVVPIFAGVIVDRYRRRPIMIGGNVVRAAVLAVVPVAAWLGFLDLPLLYVVAVIVGTAAVFVDVAGLAFFPSLVDKRELARANSWLGTSSSTAVTAGPGITGFLVGIIGAPATLLANVGALVVSVLTLLKVRHREERPGNTDEGPSPWRELLGGFGVVAKSRVVMVLALVGGTYNLCLEMIEVGLLLYATQTLRWPLPVYGLVLAAMGVGSILGSMVAARVSDRIGLGPLFAIGGVASGLAAFLIPLAPNGLLGQALAAVGLAGVGAAIVASSIAGQTIRQAVTPNELLGRMSALVRMILFAGMPLGALAGGIVGAAASPRIALIVGAVVLLLAGLAALATTVRTFVRVPVAVD